MEENEILRKQILEIVDNQLRNNDPPETKATCDRLKIEGFDDNSIKQMIGACVAVEIFDVMKFSKPFDPDRYIKNLSNLPEEPFEEEEEK